MNQNKKVLVVLGTAIILTFLLGILFDSLKSFTNPKKRINSSAVAVIKELRELNRFETAAFTIEKIIDAGTDGNRFQELLYGDKILLIANGEVIGGFDLSKLQDGDIKITDNTIRVTLPAPEILSSKLNNDETRVYDRQVGLLSAGDKDLESQARLEAERSIREAACKAGILNNASMNGRKQMNALLGGFGFTTVIVDIPAGSC